MRRSLIPLAVALGLGLAVSGCGQQLRAERDGRKLAEAVCDLSEATSADEAKSALADVQKELAKGPQQSDLAAVIAKMPEGSSSEVKRLTDQIQAERTEMRQLLTQEQHAPGHPRVQAVQSELTALGSQLSDAVDASIRALGQQIADQTAEGTKIKEEQRAFPDLQNRLHLRVVKAAAVAEGADLIRGPHELFGTSERGGRAPRAAGHGVIRDAHVVPAHRDA